MELSITVDGTQKLQRRLRATAVRARNMRPVLAFLVRDFRRIMVLQFDTSGTYLGRPWAAEAASTTERKERAGADVRLLHWTRRLRKSYTTGEEGYSHATRDELQIGSLVPYAAYIDEGTGNMPPRELFRMTARTSQRWNKSMTRYLTQGILEVDAF